jgi:NAD(P)H-hydrate epimerase
LNHIVITPHSGELASILGIEKIQPEDRINVNIQTAKKFNLVSLLKGPSTVISNKEGITFLNPTGDFALATAGTGDILTGIIGSFLCQGMSQFTSAICGAYVHGLSSDIISKNTSKTSLVATDLLDGLKQVFTKIEKLKY